jgi:uncharacterized protein
MAIYPLVLVDGPPRCGKSTLARQLAASSSAGAILARAGSPDGRRIMADPLQLSAAQPVILDGATMDEARTLERILGAQPAAPMEIPQATPARSPRFVLVGGPFRQAKPPETCLFRTRNIMAHLSLGTLTLAEVGKGSVRSHWLRGGYPEAYTAESDSVAMTNLGSLITGMCGGLLSPWSLPASPTRLATLLTCLAEAGGSPVNENSLARMLGTSRPTICRWMEGLKRAGILRRIPRMSGKGGSRRTVQAPAWQVRDSGLIHGLHGISSSADLRSMPRLAAATWRAYVLEQTAAVMPEGSEPEGYLSADGACIDLVLSKAGKVIVADTRIQLPVAPGKGTTLGADAIGATDRFMVVPDGIPRNTTGGFRIIGLAGFLDEVCKLYDQD